MSQSSVNKTYENPGLLFLETVLSHMPAAYADITGNPGTGEINGMVRFYPIGAGVLVNAEVYGLPTSDKNCEAEVFGFHVHDGHSCTGNSNDPYVDAGMHYNPDTCPHPAHAGDMPALFGNHGSAWMMFFTDRFTIADIIGRTVIIHKNTDDYTTQPSGNSGAKIACGTIQAVR